MSKMQIEAVDPTSPPEADAASDQRPLWAPSKALLRWLSILETHDDSDGHGEIQSADIAYSITLAGAAIVEALDAHRDEG
jgi:hypothetical protein